MNKKQFSGHFDFLNQIDEIKVVTHENGKSARILFRDRDIFRIMKRGSVYDVDLVRNGSEYLDEVYCKTARKQKWLHKEGDQKAIIAQIAKIRDEIQDYINSTHKAKYSDGAVSELRTIIQNVDESAYGKANQKACQTLSDGKPVVEIVYDSSKRKNRAICEWKGQTLWCKFPSKYRVHNARYVVDDVVEKNGCWSVVGEIKALCE